ncbi:hypothetical protein [Membranihabitans marinus]|uniref:hypothetical protein n=1 Tax=Membranihabitans marinus TaxID=1227546 RepID=UPI001F3DDECD|nr:hypothetical protein [Membranihabitans marinus]
MQCRRSTVAATSLPVDRLTVYDALHFGRSHPEHSGSGSLIRWTFSPLGCPTGQLHSVIIIQSTLIGLGTSYCIWSFSPESDLRANPSTTRWSWLLQAIILLL